MTADNAMAKIEKFFNEKNVVLSEFERRHIKQLLEDLHQTSFSDGFDSGYSFGYDAGYDFALTTID